MTTKIVIHDFLPLDQAAVELIRAAAPKAAVVVATKESVVDELQDAEIFYGFSPPESFRHASRLRWIQSTAAGLDRMLDDELVERGLTITNASGVHAPQVVETAWALTLSLARGLKTYFDNQREHRWKWATHHDLDGQTAGVVGLGGIGRRYARIAAAFGMRVLAVDPHPVARPDEMEAIWTMDRLDDLLSAADVLLISCPYTPETHHLIDAERLAKMKSTALLINIARGGIVDEDALRRALGSGELAGAGLDVCETEPLPPESPLWDTPHLIITPHCAGLSAARIRRLTEFFCKNLKRYFAGEPLVNTVDAKKGYPVPTGE